MSDRELTLCGNCGMCRAHGDHRADRPIARLGMHRWDPVTSRKWSPCPNCKRNSKRVSGTGTGTERAP